MAGHLPDLTSSEIFAIVGDKEFWENTDEEGNFHMELDLDWAQYLFFAGTPVNLYLVPGDSMYISNDASGSHQFVFTGGESGLINTWYAVKDSKLNTLLDTVDIKNYYSQDAVSYKNLNTWIISEFHKMLNQFARRIQG